MAGPKKSFASAARNVLNVPAYFQQYDGWRWAAADKSIIQFLKGSSPSLQDIVNSIPGGSDGATMEESQQVLTNNGVTSSRQYSSLTYNGVQWQINNNRPIWVRLSQGDGWIALHANVIRGYDTSTNFVLFIDPGDGDYHGQTYSNYCDGVHWDGNWWTWDGTIFVAKALPVLCFPCHGGWQCYNRFYYCPYQRGMASCRYRWAFK